VGAEESWDEVTYTLPQCYNHRQYHNQRGRFDIVQCTHPLYPVGVVIWMPCQGLALLLYTEREQVSCQSNHRCSYFKCQNVDQLILIAILLAMLMHPHCSVNFSFENLFIVNQLTAELLSLEVTLSLWIS